MNVKEALNAIANQNGVSVNKLLEEIQKSIDIGMQSNDPSTKEYWAKIPHAGEKPTPEEVINFLTKEIK